MVVLWIFLGMLACIWGFTLYLHITNKARKNTRKQPFDFDGFDSFDGDNGTGGDGGGDGGGGGGDQPSIKSDL